MRDPKPWPTSENPITEIRLQLMNGFDAQGQPVYTTGTVESEEEKAMLQSVLEKLHPVPRSVASVTMGEVTVELRDGSTISLQPVFHPSRDAYGDLFTVDESQYPMPEPLTELLNRWRKKSE